MKIAQIKLEVRHWAPYFLSGEICSWQTEAKIPQRMGSVQGDPSARKPVTLD